MREPIELAHKCIAELRRDLATKMLSSSRRPRLIVPNRRAMYCEKKAALGKGPLTVAIDLVQMETR
jgi:hypothetical protein